jgi:poly(3-hydroxybutyrate) depolymerase
MKHRVPITALVFLILTSCVSPPRLDDAPLPPIDTTIGDTTIGDGVADVPVDDAPIDGATPDTNLTCTTYLTDPTGVHVPACVSIPTGMMPTNGWPLVIAFHRLSGTSGEALSRMGLSGLSSWAIIIAPDGLKNGNSQYFDAGPEGCDIAVHDPTHLRDLDWAVGLIHQEEAIDTIDTTQVYATGLSNGDWMSEAIACYDPTDIVAAVTSSGSPPMNCGTPIWLRKAHGTADGTAFYDDNDPSCPGGPPCRLNGNNNLTHYYSADDPAPYGCTGFTATGVTKDYDSSTGAVGAESAEYAATGCAPGTDIDFWKMTGSLHSPGWKTLWSTDTTAWLHAHHR